MKSSSNSSRFYELLAPVYHLKVDWDNRSAKENKLFDYLISDLKPTSVLDIGCGDGGHAGRYAEAGASYLGIDSSIEMIKTASRTHQGRSGVNFATGDMARLAPEYAGGFDQAVMLGNTLPHVLTARDLTATLSGVSRSLQPHGYFVVQTVNPGSFANKKIHFLAPKKSGDVLFAPFYLNQGETWDFYMPIYRLAGDAAVAANIASTRLRFWSRQELTERARKSGLTTVAAFGNSRLDPYHTRTSDNLILVFRKLANARTSRS